MVMAARAAIVAEALRRQPNSFFLQSMQALSVRSEARIPVSQKVEFYSVFSDAFGEATANGSTSPAS